MEIKKENIKNILLVKLCCLGDIVFFTPVIENLRINFPDAKLTLICSKWLKNVVPFLRNLDEVIYYEGPYEESFSKKLISTFNTILKLRKNKYDLAVVGHRNNFYGLFTKLSSIKYRLGYTGTKHLTHTVDFNSEAHIVDKNIAILNPLDLSIIKREPILKKLKENSNLSDRKIIGVFPFGGVNPGTNMTIKRWNLKNYLKVIDNIKKDYSIILFEGLQPGEQLPSEYKQNVTTELMSNEALAECDIFISGDTGPLHIASAMGVSTIALFGPTDPELLKPRGPDQNANLVIWKKPECSPCYTPVTAADRSNPEYWDGNTFKCHTGTHICMKSISVEEVVSSIKSIKVLNNE